MRAGIALLALCLCAAGARADYSPPASCSQAGLSGGWQPVDPAAAQAVATDIFAQFVASYGANLTSLLGVAPLPEDANVTFSVGGCSQVVAGTNYKLWINATTQLDNKTVTVGITADAFEPLPSDANNATQVYDVDFDFVEVDGKVVVSDDNDAKDGPDTDNKWEVDATGQIVANPTYPTGSIYSDDSDDLLDDVRDGPMDDVDDMDGPGGKKDD